MNENILRYIQQYRQTYTREAITEQLTRAGYNLAEIEAAWVVLEAGTVPPDQPPWQNTAPGQQPPPGLAPPGAVPGQQPPPDPFGGQRPPGWEAPRNQATPPPGSAPGWQAPPGGYGPPGGQMYAQPPRPPRLRSNPRFWVTFLGYLFGLPALVAASSAINSDLGTIIFWLGLAGGIIGLLTLHRKDYAVARGLLAALILLIVVPIVLGFIAIVIVLGMCLVVGTRI